jgi:hypothetical protein
VTGTWCRRGRSARCAWKSEHENVGDRIGGQIDYVLVDGGFGNGMQGSGSMQGRTVGLIAVRSRWHWGSDCIGTGRPEERPGETLVT